MNTEKRELINLTEQEKEEYKGYLIDTLNVLASERPQFAPEENATLTDLLESFFCWADEYNDHYFSEMKDADTDRYCAWLVQEYTEFSDCDKFCELYTEGNTFDVPYTMEKDIDAFIRAYFEGKQCNIKDELRYELENNGEFVDEAIINAFIYDELDKFENDDDDSLREKIMLEPYDNSRLISLVKDISIDGVSHPYKEDYAEVKITISFNKDMAYSLFGFDKLLEDNEKEKNKKDKSDKDKERE